MLYAPYHLAAHFYGKADALMQCPIAGHGPCLDSNMMEFRSGHACLPKMSGIFEKISAHE